MTGAEVLEWLEEELEQFPERASGEDLYHYLIVKTRPQAAANRMALVRALSSWLATRSEPRTMLAVEIAVAHRLKDLSGEIDQLLSDVESGRAFLPHYADPIRNALSKL